MAKVPRSLAGLTVAITGGARGIGRATASALLAQGARVAIGDIDASLAEQTAAELGSGTIGLPLDVTSRASFAAFLDQVEERLGPLDVLINNAGIMPVGPFVEETDATAKRMVDINVHGVILGSKLALERFIPRRRGHLVNIASIAGKAGSPHLATYVASKHAVVGLTESIRQELAGTGIDVSVVMPIGVNTELYSGLPQLRGMKTPEPEDVADAIVEALQTQRYEVFVPKRMKGTVKLGALLPLRARDWINRVTGGDQVMTQPDHAARAAYEARMQETIEGPSPAPAAAAPPAAAEAPAPAEPATNGADDTEAAAREKEAV
ncbi:MAG TPA: SDR family oxidoreductase [Solirubrobacteraceae bacterium]|jgi:NAD(P)-dependent dehydrogenase (short-subunit alcohol dehydrogenase family)